MPTTELPGWLALTALALFTLGALCFATAGATLLTRTLRHPRPTVTDADWNALDHTCCLRHWETRGADHDRTHCRRTTAQRPTPPKGPTP
jgi:hypothetical protein